MSHLSSVQYNEVLNYLTQNQQTINCPICDSNTNSLVRKSKERGGFIIKAVCCLNCGHIFLNPRPTLEAYEKFYFHSHYRAYVDKEELDKINKTRMDEMQKSEFIQKRISHGHRLYDIFAKDILKSGDLVFDFGCGDGAWLAGIKEKCDCQISGQDPDLFYKDYIKQTFKFDIHIGVIEKMYGELKNIYNKKIKLAIVSGSLQHMIDPMECLRFIHEVLRDDGYLYICNKNVFTHKIHLNIPFSKHISIDHPHYFHKSSYYYMAEKSGFEILKYNDNSLVRSKHMEIFAKKTTPKEQITPLVTPEKIIKQIKSSEYKIPIRKAIQAIRSLF